MIRRLLRRIFRREEDVCFKITPPMLGEDVVLKFWKGFPNEPQREKFRIHADGTVVLSAELHEAAERFWQVVKELVPQGYSLDVEGAPQGFWQVVKELAPQGYSLDVEGAPQG